MTEKCKKNEYHRRTYEGLAPLTREVQAIAKPILGRRGFAEIDILGSWEEMVGADLARGILPEKLTFEKDKRVNGTLYVKSAGGAFATLFEFQKQRVIERINCFFGYPAVAQIKIRQGALKLKSETVETARSLTPAEEKELQKRVSAIEDEELRTQAYEIGKAILIKK
ncbi:MAG: DUF721 domain-containing protein [Alphaproteobacteria bacterium]|nr:DUF721 domain-containing protein [Alphaproteobacteria bacterium]